MANQPQRFFTFNVDDVSYLMWNMFVAHLYFTLICMCSVLKPPDMAGLMILGIRNKIPQILLHV